MTVQLDKMKSELVKIQHDLQPVAKNEYLGRAIRKLEAGLQKLEHFLKTFSWETKQERALVQVVSILMKDEKEFFDAARAYKEKGLDSDEIDDYRVFTNDLYAHLQTMKSVCKQLKAKPEKVNKETVEGLEKDIERLIKVCEKEIPWKEGEREFGPQKESRIGKHREVVPPKFGASLEKTHLERNVINQELNKIVTNVQQFINKIKNEQDKSLAHQNFGKLLEVVNNLKNKLDTDTHTLLQEAKAFIKALYQNADKEAPANLFKKIDANVKAQEENALKEKEAKTEKK